MLNLTTTTNIKERRIFTFSPLEIKAHSFFFFFFVMEQHRSLTCPRSSLNHWRAESWSSGLKRSSICPNSCVVQKGWNWWSASRDRRRRVHGWRGRRVRWVCGVCGARLALNALAGSDSGKARFEESRLNRIDWTWGTDFWFLKSMAGKQRKGKIKSYSTCTPMNSHK